MRVLVWGTGQLSWHIINDFTNGEIVGFIDTYKRQETFADKPVYLPGKLEGVHYDAIIVAVAQTEGIIRTIEECHIDISKVIFAYGNISINDYNKDYEFVEKICGKDLSKRIKNRYHLVRSTDSKLDEEILFCEGTEIKNDYVRIKTFELLVKEIKKNEVVGNVAELGVFRGDFAKYINKAFPERTLYLFDTFDGFDENELKNSVEGDVLTAGREVFKNTSIEEVAKKMTNNDKCDYRIGLFPASLKGLEDEFAFVSIDCDFEESIYSGLEYFYPRLSEGGYIMIHDYNNFLGCAKESIRRFEKVIGRGLCKVPICDNQGTLIISK
ncbi:TylF/MycF/NovP-related O-methyltransferase [Butyrivibrio sp. CB08]|uniref:TylF/MycF/NovP-related O-methyltransferase n=1 Tax=Butyrivibrio sp. CB08 TaxID=2364879 RepID=UPI0013144235|nr:TylF/MycF/NovP-related O-methyltransferase [Butyrivibrio sp. CB08]